MDPISLFLLIAGIALQAAGTLIQQSQQQDQQDKVTGVRGTLDVGGDSPLAFIVGRYGTAGHLEYAGTWGDDGGTPNAYYTKVISVSDLPVRALAGFFVNGQRVTLGDTANGDLGFPVAEYSKDGKDHLWVKFYDGTQTAVDALLLAKFGSDPDRPWKDDMIGNGVAYFVATALIDNELFAGFPDYLAEIDGITLSDSRGDGANENPIVAIDTIMGGLSYDDVWVYGPQNIGASRRPAANWQAQMDKCDAAITISDGSTEPRFRIGMEITVDQEPQAVFGEMLKGCQGRIAEIGGIYKVLVAEPDDPVIGFTDEDVDIDEGQSYDPFPGLEDTYNAITATYPEPAEAWESKEAPPRYRSDLETLDDGRRLPFSTDYKAVPYAFQVQRLMLAAIEETRRFRQHVQTMPPEWWEYEPLDVAAWTSARNGYDAKQFLITAIEDQGNANQVVSLQEIDQADYGWSSDDELPFDVSPLIIARPPPQPMAGFAVSPYEFPDSLNSPRRPGILLEYTGGLQDIRAVAFQVREGWGSNNLVATGEITYDTVNLEAAEPIGGQWTLPNAAYQVRAKFLPPDGSGRETNWSDWLDVTTPDIRVAPEDLGAELRADRAFFQDALNALQNDLTLLSAVVQDALGINYQDKRVVLASVLAKFNANQASIQSVAETAASETAAAAELATAAQATADKGTASGIFEIQAQSTPDGVSAQVGASVSADDGATFSEAHWVLGVNDDGSTFMRLEADTVEATNSDGTYLWKLDLVNGNSFEGSV